MWVKTGSLASAFLYKEATVLDNTPDPGDYQYSLLRVAITDLQMHAF